MCQGFLFVFWWWYLLNILERGLLYSAHINKFLPPEPQICVTRSRVLGHTGMPWCFSNPLIRGSRHIGSRCRKSILQGPSELSAFRSVNLSNSALQTGTAGLTKTSDHPESLCKLSFPLSPLYLSMFVYLTSLGLSFSIRDL